jgi:predicted RNA-binding protein with PUA-like domain
MKQWLMKSEPDVFSIADLKKKGSVPWDGVRNYTARNFMRDQMKKGDKIFFYHSSCPEPGIAGLARVIKESQPDPTQFDPKSKYFDPKATPTQPRWFLVEVAYEKTAKKVIPLEWLKEIPALKNMALIRFGRLSVQPVTASEWSLIMKLKGYW